MASLAAHMRCAKVGRNDTIPLRRFWCNHPHLSHDAIVEFIDGIMLTSGFRPQREPDTRGIFTTLLPPPLLMSSWGRPGVIPDLVADVSMPAITPGRSARPGAALPSRRLLWDVKTIYGGTTRYGGSARAREDQSGAVAARAALVWPDYLTHAARLDVAHSPAGTTPIQDRLRSFSPTRALVFGSYGEGSADVHALIAAAASAQAGRVWRRWGSRSESEARGIVTAALRRSVGVFVAREFARHRLRRVPMVGVPRAALDARRGRRYGGSVVQAAVGLRDRRCVSPGLLCLLVAGRSGSRRHGGGLVGWPCEALRVPGLL